MQKQEPCENCGKLVAPHESVNLGSIEKGYRRLCMACTNAAIAKHAGVDFKHPDYQPMTLTDCEGGEHEFHFNTHLLGDKVAIDALEIRNGEPRGYRFQVISDDPEEDTFESFRRLFDRIQRALTQKHLEKDKYGLHIGEHHTVRAIIDCDLEHPERRPLLVIDGKEIDWDEFGRMLMTYEGFQFKMEIYDISEER